MRRDCQRCIARFCRAMHLLIVQPYAKPLRAQQQSSTAMRPSMPSSRASRAATSAPSAETVARLAARDRLRLPAVCRRTALSLHVLPCKRPARRRQSRSPTPSSCVSSVSGGSLEIRRSQLRKSLSGSRHSRQQQCPAASKKTDAFAHAIAIDLPARGRSDCVLPAIQCVTQCGQIQAKHGPQGRQLLRSRQCCAGGR